MTSSGDEGVISTNDDAASCKRFATHLQYWRDDYIQHFVRKLPERKTPEISRGYYIRVYAMRELVSKFLDVTECDCQIVNLGAGFDTLFWNLHDVGKIPKGGFYEIDMKPVTQRKIMAIKTRPQLQKVFQEGFKYEGGELHSKTYHLVDADLRNVSGMDEKLVAAGLDKSKPTLFICECLLVYLQPDHTESLFNYINSNYSSCMVLDYDPVNLGDRFGQIMIQNLRGRQCALLGAHPTLDSKISSFRSAGFESVQSKLLLAVYNELPYTEKCRVESLEFLDEVDLLYSLLEHYAISVAYTDRTNTGFNRVHNM